VLIVCADRHLDHIDVRAGGQQSAGAGRLDAMPADDPLQLLRPAQNCGATLPEKPEHAVPDHLLS